MKMTASRHGGNAPSMIRPLEVLVVLALAIGTAVASVAGVSALPTKAALAATNDNLRAPGEYSITDLGTLPGGIHSEANAINNRGQVAGLSETNFFYEDSAILWDNGQMRDLGPLGGYYFVKVTDLNDRGQVVAFVGSKTEERAVLWDNGQVTNLGSLGGGSFTEAFAINNRGQVVGTSLAPSPDDMWDVESHAFLWQNGNMSDLGTLPGGGSYGSTATDINDLGQVVGRSGTASGESHAFLWQNGNMRDLGTLPGGNFSEANAINGLGQVVGRSGTNSGEGHAVLWSKQGT